MKNSNLKQTSIYCVECETDIRLKHLFAHLHLPSKHKLAKHHRLQNLKDLQSLIHERISSLTSFQSSIQKTSAELINSITANATKQLHQINSLIKLYKNILFTSETSKTLTTELINYSIAECLNVNKSVKGQIKAFFDQQFLQLDLLNKRRKMQIEEKFYTFWQEHNSLISCIDYSSDKRFAVSGEMSGIIRIWRLEDYKQIGFTRGYKSVVFTIALTTDNSYIVSASYDSMVRLWDFRSLRLIHCFEGHSDFVNSPAISGNNSKVYSGSSFSIKL